MNKKNALILVFVGCAVFVGLGIGIHKWRKSHFYEGTPVFTDKKVILKLYQLMKDVDGVLSKNNISYWVDFGSLLGAVRHTGIIPWDDDLDISIEITDEQKLVALALKFKELGYGFIPTCIGYKIFPLDGEKVYYKDEDCRFPFMDVYLREWRDKKLYYIFRNRKKSPLRERREDEPIYSLASEIYPLKEYQFGEIMVKGPQNPEPHMFYCFGKDWFDVAYQTVSHQGKLAKKVKKNLTDSDRVPAQPTGPLKNR